MWWLILTIIVCTFIIVKVIREQSPEAQKRKIFKEIETLKPNIDLFRDAVMHKEPGIVEGRSLDELREDLTKMEENYRRLVVKEKNTLTGALELTIDLRDYFEALASLHNTECLLVVDMSNKTAENYGELTAEPRAKKEEIEQKFKHLLAF